MATLEAELLDAFELHSAAQIRSLLERGVDAKKPMRGKLPIVWLTEMYTRSDYFPECLQVLLDHGAQLEDPLVTPVLLDDADALAAALHALPSLLEHRTTMTSAFTPLVGASLLHLAAEFGNLAVARVLIEHGADVEARAAIDEFGLGGHTPLFHVVNSNANRSAPVMRLLLDAGARTDVRIAGLTWGRDFDWETTLFDITPLSFAQFGLLPQIHRDERDIAANVRTLLAAASRPVPPLRNVPNRYLQPRPAAS